MCIFATFLDSHLKFCYTHFLDESNCFTRCTYFQLVKYRDDLNRRKMFENTTFDVSYRINQKAYSFKHCPTELPPSFWACLTAFRQAWYSSNLHCWQFANTKQPIANINFCSIIVLEAFALSWSKGKSDTTFPYGLVYIAWKIHDVLRRNGNFFKWTSSTDFSLSYICDSNYFFKR